MTEGQKQLAAALSNVDWASRVVDVSATPLAVDTIQVTTQLRDALRLRQRERLAEKLDADRGTR